MRFLSSEKLSAHKYKTPEGYLICTDAILARTGKQTYRKNEVFADAEDDSEIEVDRRPEDVFSDETMASFENKPITVEHPDRDVNAENHNELSVGFARDIRRATIDGQDVMIGNLVITDAQTIEEIENGEHVELSCGYDCDIEDENNPVQKNIRGNHIALCERGRAGIARIVDSVNDAHSKTYGELKDGDKIYFYGHKATVSNVKVVGKADFGRHKGENIISFNVEFDKNDELSKYGQYQSGRYQGVESISVAMQDSINDSINDSTAEVEITCTEPGNTKTYRQSFKINASTAEDYLRGNREKATREIYNEVFLHANMLFGETRIKVLNIKDSTAPADLERIPLEARKEMKEAKDKKATLIGIAGQMQDIINRADKIEKDDLRAKAKKILSDLKAQFDIKEADFITVDTKDDLIQSSSEEAFKKNIATEIKAGKDPKQAAAIAYSVKRENDSTKDSDYSEARKAVEHWKKENKLAEEIIKLLNQKFSQLSAEDRQNAYEEATGTRFALKYFDSLKRFEIHEGENITIVRAKDLADAMKKIKDNVETVNASDLRPGDIWLSDYGTWKIEQIDKLHFGEILVIATKTTTGERDRIVLKQTKRVKRQI